MKSAILEANRKDSLLDGYLDDVFEAVRLARAAGIICELRLWNGGGAEALNSSIVSRIGQAFDVQPGGIPDGFSDRKLGENLHLVFAPSFEWPSLEAQSSGDAVFCRGLRDHLVFSVTERLCHAVLMEMGLFHSAMRWRCRSMQFSTRSAHGRYIMAFHIGAQSNRCARGVDMHVDFE